jgi:hypothetical protein
VRCNLSLTTKVDLAHAPRHNADSGENLMQNAAPGVQCSRYSRETNVVRVPSDVQGGTTWLIIKN